MTETDMPEKAEVVILNSCSVRGTAEHRIFGHVKNFVELKKIKPELIIGVTGCMAGRDKDGKIKKKLKGVDLFFATSEMVDLPRQLAALNPKIKYQENLELDYLNLLPNYHNKSQALVTIQTGCNQFCTYCVVPYARGIEGNRSLKSILAEVRELAKNGCLEICLLGQIVNHYVAPDPEYFSKNNPYQKNDFAKLLWEINQLKGIERIFWTAPHPLYMDEEVIDAITLSKQMNYLHLPMQSGSTEVLKKMNRKHNREYFAEVIKKVRAKRPAIAIGTDIIVGFCGETEEDFQQTLDLYRDCDLDISYHAKYSPRPGTVATKMFKDDITLVEKKKRWFRLQHLMEEMTLRKNQKYLGQTVSVLVDKYQNGVCEGNSSEMKRVEFAGEKDLLGKIVAVKINWCGAWILRGNML
jgi:tRNA-2-methylthio-N6-dimethylallyladenosine synthase